MAVQVDSFDATGCPLEKEKHEMANGLADFKRPLTVLFRSSHCDWVIEAPKEGRNRQTVIRRAIMDHIIDEWIVRKDKACEFHIEEISLVSQMGFPDNLTPMKHDRSCGSTF